MAGAAPGRHHRASGRCQYPRQAGQTPRCPPPASLTWLAPKVARPPDAATSPASGSWNRAATAARSASGATAPSPCRWWRRDSVNRQPTSAAVGHSATESTPYRTTENRIQLSVRTPARPGAATQGPPHAQGFGGLAIRQQSYWQLFTPQISRPFPVHRPRARNHARLPHHRPAALWLALALQRRGPWCTSPTARATRCRAAGTGCT